MAKILAQHSPKLTQDHLTPILVCHGALAVCDPYYVDETTQLITNLEIGEWVGQSALFVEGVDEDLNGIKFYSLQVAVSAFTQNLDLTNIKMIHDRFGGPANFFGSYAASAQIIKTEMSNGISFIDLINETTATLKHGFTMDLDRSKYLILRDAAKILSEFYSHSDAQERLAQIDSERKSPLYARVQYFHLKHKDRVEFSDHDSNDWVGVGEIETSSGKLAVFENSWFTENTDLICEKAEELSTHYMESKNTRNPVNVRKISTSSIGLATITPCREHHTAAWAILDGGKMVEILIHFDPKHDD